MTEQEFEDKKTEIARLQAECAAAGKDLFVEGFKAVLDAHPSVKKVVWNQYTPYFNDGDACYFSANTYDFDLNDDEDFVGRTEAEEAVSAFRNKFEDDDYLAFFGDHVTVTVTRDGIETEHCEHD